MLRVQNYLDDLAAALEKTQARSRQRAQAGAVQGPAAAAALGRCHYCCGLQAVEELAWCGPLATLLMPCPAPRRPPSRLARLPQALCCWHDPVATSIAVAGLLAAAALIFLLGFSPVLGFVLFWIARPPRLRTPTPPPPANLFRRLPSRADRIM